MNTVCVNDDGFTQISGNGKEVNYNYYDDKELTGIMYDFIVTSLRTQISFGINTDVCYCLGTGKNYKFLADLNAEEKLFNSIIPIEHPRYIMQYRRRRLQFYIDKYTGLLK